MNARLLRMAAAAAVALSTAIAPGPARPEGPVRELFEGFDATWRFGNADAQHRIEAHGRTQKTAHSGIGSEHWAIRAAAGGTFVYLEHPLAPAIVIDELRASVWVRATRPRVQTLVRIVLPREIDPATGRPRTVVIPGSSTQGVGRWEQLAVQQMHRLVAGQVRVLRAQLGRDVDAREAYIDALLLNVYAGEGLIEVWTDDLELSGVVGRADQAAGGGSLVAAASAFEEIAPQSVARMSAGQLYVGDRPIAPRLIEHQGEPLRFLRELGFNGVWISQPPTRELLADAARNDMWIVAPPPEWTHPASAASALAGGKLGAEYGRVLAWDLGHGLTERELEPSRAWADRVRAADGHNGRPLLAGVQSPLMTFSRSIDILSLDRWPLFTGFDLPAYRQWLLERQRLALPGAPAWAIVPTMPAIEVDEQWRAAAGARADELIVGNEAPRLLAWAAIASGARGLVFASRTPLDAGDEASRWRALLLERTNQQLALLEPWIAKGSVRGTAASSDPEVQATVLAVEGAQLLAPVWIGPGGQSAPHRPGPARLTFLAPGIAASNSVYQIVPTGMEPLMNRRKAGGVEIAVDNFDLTAMVMLTQHPQIQNDVARRLAETSARAASLEREIAEVKLATTRRLADRLAALGHAPRDTAARLRAADQALRTGQTMADAGHRREALAQFQEAVRQARSIEYGAWRLAVDNAGSAVTLPFTVGYGGLARHWRMMDSLAVSRRSADLLPEGKFDDLERMRAAGWQHFEQRNSDVRSHAELAPRSRLAGGQSLHLRVEPMNAEAPPLAVETPPLWVTSPPVEVRAGQIVRIHGWVRVPRPITGSQDGLLVVDSLGGEPLAERIDYRDVDDWREFTLYRAAPTSRAMSVTFAMTGLGEAWIDDVTIEPVVGSGTGAPQPQPMPRQPNPLERQQAGATAPPQWAPRQRAPGPLLGNAAQGPPPSFAPPGPAMPPGAPATNGLQGPALGPAWNVEQGPAFVPPWSLEQRPTTAPPLARPGAPPQMPAPPGYVEPAPRDPRSPGATQPAGLRRLPPVGQ